MGTGAVDIDRWSEEHAAYFPDRAPSEVALVLALWREQAVAASGIADLTLAGPLQRHLTARGTGMPSSFALIVTPAEVVAWKFDPRNSHHPLEVVAKQFKKRVAAWPLASVRLSDVEPGRMASGLTLRIDGGEPVPCRTPRLDANPAAAALVTALGGELPS